MSTKPLFSLLAAAAISLASSASPGQSSAAQSPDAPADKLRIGITLHPYYSFVSNIVGDLAEVVPLIDANANPHGYSPQPDDMIRMTSMDALVVNGIGHDSWAFEILDAAGVSDGLPLIHANDGVSLIPVAGDPSGAKIVNPHTFISSTAAIQQIYTIARGLGELDPGNARAYRDNARRYALDIRRLRAEFDAQIAELDLSAFRCATMHSGYDYLLQELGLQVTAVIEPRHGVEPSARQLADTVARIKSANVNVLFAEKYFASQLSETIQAETGVQMYSISHISSGPYTPERFSEDMRENLATLARAIRESGEG
ncbi:MAG TPA: zinc ABC transporter substrate-binding protein [Gammaproteobacteria bacterium]|nr:zinc ABC transporter substrate-binding protein [Gammaproteobacteria bacterium]